MAKRQNPSAAPQPGEPAETAGSAATSSSSETQVTLFPEEKLYMLKLGSVDVPVVEDGKGFFKSISQAAWTLDHQRALLRYWREQAAENRGFNIEAKMAKLFVLPQESEA